MSNVHQMQPLLTREQIQAAFEVLASPSNEIGAARANLIRKEYRVKRVHAKLMRQAPEGSVEMRKAWATDHDDYAAACDDHAEAEGEWERLKDQRNKAELVMEAWRTMSSNDRTAVRATR